MSLFDDNLATKEFSLESLIRMDFEECLRVAKKLHQKRKEKTMIGINKYRYMSAILERMFRSNDHWTYSDPDHGRAIKISHHYQFVDYDINEDITRYALYVDVTFEDGVIFGWKFETVF